MSDLRAGIAAANLPTLVLMLTQMTGDLTWLEPPFQPTRSRGLSDNDSGGFDDATATAIRTAAHDAITAWKAGRPIALADPSDELLIRMLTISLGEPVPDGYALMMRQELGLGAPIAPRSEGPDDRRVLIIGAGASGICMSVHLARQGIAHTLIERNADIGGTWHENRYPGCGVDVPSHLYQYSFAPHAWPRWFALRDDIVEYLERVAREHGIYERTRFNTEVLGATYDADAQGWTIDVRTADGASDTVHADVVISAVGAFNKPRLPTLPGMENFLGEQAHTARWPTTGMQLQGKRVAVVGTGASSMQVVPAIAADVAHLDVFQRAPQWAAPFEKFRVRVPEPVTALMNDVPLYAAWYRQRISWAFNDRVWDSLQKDPHWPHPDRSINAINEGQRRALTRYIESQLGDREDLRAHAIPTYPPFGKRMLLDNGWFRTLRRDNVVLHPESVREVRPEGVVSESGELHEVDAIVWATGFDVVNFLVPMHIVGRSGRTLQEHWDGDDARAYLGVATPEFPNFFMLYGPNAQFGHGGSLITVVERHVRYITDLLNQLRTAGKTVAEIRPDVCGDYNRRVDEAHEKMVWTHEGMDTYYRNSRGRIVVNNPFRMVDVWRWTERADLGEYVTENPTENARVAARTAAE